MARKGMSYCRVDMTEEEGDYGRPQPCVYVVCNKTGHEVGPIWGHSGRSVRRALATLSEECSCGGYHVEKD